MIGEGSAIRKYQKKLPVELSKRYGGSGSYTQAQVDITVKELGLSSKHIKFAYLMFCEQKEWDANFFSSDIIEKMNSAITAAVGGGIVAGPIEGIFGSTGGDGGGFGDGGGGGGE